MDYYNLQKQILSIKNTKNIKTVVIGKSVLGKNIYAVCCNTEPQNPWVIVTAGIHAREHLSCDLVVKLIHKYIKKNNNYGYNIAFIPLVNPDGATLCINGVTGLCPQVKNKLLAINGSADFSLYKANANGVDLNNNFNALWHKKHTTKTKPSSQGFYGHKPNSEPETQALVKLTNKLKPFITISYHLKGEQIYFDFYQNKKHYLRDSKIAKIFAMSTGYAIKSTQYVSSGGYKDWCVYTLKIPSLTIELGTDKYNHPYPQHQLNSIYQKNEDLFNCLQKSLKIYNLEKYNGTHENSYNLGTKSL